MMISQCVLVSLQVILTAVEPSASESSERSPEFLVGQAEGALGILLEHEGRLSMLNRATQRIAESTQGWSQAVVELEKQADENRNDNATWGEQLAEIADELATKWNSLPDDDARVRLGRDILNEIRRPQIEWSLGYRENAVADAATPLRFLCYADLGAAEEIFRQIPEILNEDPELRTLVLESMAISIEQLKATCRSLRSVEQSARYLRQARAVSRSNMVERWRVYIEDELQEINRRDGKDLDRFLSAAEAGTREWGLCIYKVVPQARAHYGMTNGQSSPRTAVRRARQWKEALEEYKSELTWESYLEAQRVDIEACIGMGLAEAQGAIAWAEKNLANRADQMDSARRDKLQRMERQVNFRHQPWCKELLDTAQASNSVEAEQAFVLFSEKCVS